MARHASSVPSTRFSDHSLRKLLHPSLVLALAHKKRKHSTIAGTPRRPTHITGKKALSGQYRTSYKGRAQASLPSFRAACPVATSLNSRSNRVVSVKAHGAETLSAARARRNKSNGPSQANCRGRRQSLRHTAASRYSLLKLPEKMITSLHRAQRSASEQMLKTATTKDAAKVARSIKPTNQISCNPNSRFDVRIPARVAAPLRSKLPSRYRSPRTWGS